MYTCAFIRLTYSRAMTKVAGLPECTKDTTKVRNWWGPKSWIVLVLLIIILILVKSLCSDNSVLIVDNKVYLKRANYAYLVARSMIQWLTECQYELIEKCTPTWPLKFILMSMSGTYYTYHMGWEYEEYVIHLLIRCCCGMVCYRKNSRSEFLR